MNLPVLLKCLMLNIFVCLLIAVKAQKPPNWTSEQLLSPATLADAITSNKVVPVIISVGPGAPIPNSYDAGMASKPEGLAKLQQQLNNLPKDTSIVVYCGCCPFEHCPNVRPAIDLLNSLHFTNYHVLDIPHNIKQDWIDKGYPVTEK